MSDEATDSQQTSYPLWECQLTAQRGGSTPFTAGEVHELQCQGEPIDKMEQAPSIVFDDQANQYALRILETQFIDYESAAFLVTGYKPGDYSQVPFRISDGFSGFRVENLNWQIESVLDPKQEQKPFGPMGPLELKVPLWIWLTAILVALAVVFWVVTKLRKANERKKILEELETHSTALSPYNQFNKDVRSIKRKFQGTETKISVTNYFDQVDNTFRLYLVRELKVPALEWRVRDIMAEIKRRHKLIYKNFGSNIRKVLLELEKTKQQGEKIQTDDCDQLLKMSRESATEIYHQLREKKS